MGITAESGPLIGYGLTQTSSGQVTEYNEERGPSLFDLGGGMLDPRYQFNYKPGAAVGSRLYGIFDNYAYVDYVPATINSCSIFGASAMPAAGTPIVLTPSTALGTFQTTLQPPEGGPAVSVIAIDSTAQFLSFGTGNAGSTMMGSTSGTVCLWNPAAGTGRVITITSNSSVDTGSYVIAGRDMYGFKMTETQLIADGSTALGANKFTMTGRKAFKYVSGVTASSSSTLTSTTVSVGFGDTYGLPLYTAYTGLGTFIQIVNTASAQTAVSSGPITLGTTVTANVQVSSGIDVRGTYASTTASNGTIRLQIAQNITPKMISGITPTDASAMFGLTQFSSV